MSNGSSANWKEQLGIVSGNILVTGLALTQLWPTVANYQTGVHTHAWNLTWSLHQIKPDYVVYWYLVLVLGLAVTAVALSAVHIVCRGITLTQSVPSNTLDSLCEWSYRSVFVLLGLLLFVTVGLLIELVAAWFRDLLVHHSISNRWAETIAQSIFFISVIAGILVGMSRLAKQSWISSREVIWSVAVYLLIALVCAEACFTMNLGANKNLFQRTPSEIVQINLALGGATSAAGEGKLQLRRQDEAAIRELALQDIGHGQYAAYFQSADLPAGNYRVVWEYPHTSLTASFPFLRAKTEKSVGFLVVP